jgi:hypothetical protein
MYYINKTVMKKVKFLVIFGLALLITGTSSLAQETKKEKDYKFTVKINPLNALGGPFWFAIIPISGEYKLNGEFAFAKKMSFQLGASYIGPSVLLNLDRITTDTADVSGIKTNGFKITAMYKYYLSRDLNAPEGFYVAPHFSYAKATISSTRDDGTKYSLSPEKLNVNLCIGYQFITSGGFSLDLFTGLGYVTRKWNYAGETSGILDLGKNKTGVSIPFGFSFGYAF